MNFFEGMDRFFGVSGAYLLHTTASGQVRHDKDESGASAEGLIFGMARVAQIGRQRGVSLLCAALLGGEDKKA